MRVISMSVRLVVLRLCYPTCDPLALLSMPPVRLSNTLASLSLNIVTHCGQCPYWQTPLHRICSTRARVSPLSFDTALTPRHDFRFKCPFAFTYFVWPIFRNASQILHFTLVPGRQELWAVNVILPHSDSCSGAPPDNTAHFVEYNLTLDPLGM